MMKYGLEENIIKDVVLIFSSFPEAEEAVLYGSREKGNYKPGSDTDITLAGEKPGISLLNKTRSKLDELYLPHTFDLSVFNHIDNAELREHTTRVGIFLFKR